MLPILGPAGAISQNATTLVGAGAWSPLSLPNIAGWWKADAATLSGATVTAVPDQSGNGNHLNVIGGSPQYSATSFNSDSPGITLSSGMYLRRNSINYTGTAMSVAIVCYGAAITQATGARLFSLATTNDYTTPGFAFIHQGSAGNDYAYSSGSIPLGGGTSNLNPHVIFIVFDGVNTCTIYIANSSFGVATVGSPTLGSSTAKLTFGADEVNGQQWEGVIGEAITTTSAFSGGDRSSLYTYLQGRFSGI